MIANDLNDHHIPTRHGDLWSYSTTTNIITNPIYMGKIRRNWSKQVKTMENGQIKKHIKRKKNLEDYRVYDGLHPGLITEEQFVQAQELRLGRQQAVKVRDGFVLKNAFAGLQIITALQSAPALLAADPVVTVTAAVAGLAAAVAARVSASQEAGERTKALMESAEESKTAYEENAAKQEEYEAQETGSGNTQKLQNDINELTAAQEANTQQIAELEEASREYGEQQAEAAQKTKEMTSRIDEINGKRNAKRATQKRGKA